MLDGEVGWLWVSGDVGSIWVSRDGGIGLIGLMGLVCECECEFERGVDELVDCGAGLESGYMELDCFGIFGNLSV